MEVLDLDCIVSEAGDEGEEDERKSWWRHTVGKVQKRLGGEGIE